jgi:hypothetical protein
MSGVEYDDDLRGLDADKDVRDALGIHDKGASYSDVISRTALAPGDLNAPVALYNKGSACCVPPPSHPPSEKPKSPVGGKGQPEKMSPKDRKILRDAKASARGIFERIKKAGSFITKKDIDFYRQYGLKYHSIHLMFRHNLYEYVPVGDVYKNYDKFMCIEKDQFPG